MTSVRIMEGIATVVQQHEHASSNRHAELFHLLSDRTSKVGQHVDNGPQAEDSHDVSCENLYN